MNNFINDNSIVINQDKLEKFYRAKSLTNQLYLEQKLYILMIEEGRDLVKHGNIFKEIFD